MPEEPAAEKVPRPRLDRGVLWSLGLLLASFPLMLVFLVLVSWAATGLGIELGSGSPQDEALNTAYVVAVVAVLAMSALLGLVAWRRRGQTVGAVVAALALLTAALFLALPSLLSAG
jgi:hypothetical protein